MAERSSSGVGGSLSSDPIEEVSDSEKGEYVHDFGGDSTLPPPPILTPEEEAKIWRKIDVRVVPILTMMYLALFLDRGTSCHCSVSYNANDFFQAILVRYKAPYLSHLYVNIEGVGW